MPIVYDGTEGSGHGDLFKGMKLFISFRVPQRARWVNLVKGNGGEVVPLESQADMLISDHVKRNGVLPPPGSYSWQWIQYSVQNGFLQSQDDYRIQEAPARSAGAPRVAGTSAPTKTHRSKFTAQDDDILAKFVWDKEKQGCAIKGNVIFEELDQKYPNRHTAQSWRDRWVKYVSNRPRPNMPQENPLRGARAGAFSGRDGRRVDQPQQSRAARPSNMQATPSRSAGSTPENQAQGRTRFTEEDDEALLKMIREIYEEAAAKGKTVRGLDGNKIFEELAAKNNRHSAQSWRNRWVRHLKATFEHEELEVQDEAEVPDSPAVSPKPQRRGSREPTATRTQAKGAPASSSAAVPSPRPPTQRKPQPGSDEERLKRQQQRKKRARAATLLQRSWRGHVVRRDCAQLEASIVPLQSLIRGYLLRMRETQQLLDASEGNAEPLEHDHDEDVEQYEDTQEDVTSEVDGNNSGLRDQFYEDLRDYIDVSDANVELRPMIHGREIELWDLFSTATQQNCTAEDRDWEQVAQRLGFDRTSPAGCAKQLEECYNRNLAEFEEAIGSYDDQDGTAMAEDDQASRDGEDQALVQTSDAVTAPKQPSPALLSPAYRSSSPIAGVKRSFQQSNDPLSELSYPSDSSRKRRRRDREAAIPQTPEHELRYGGESSSRAPVQDFSPSMSRGRATDPQGIFSMDEAEAFLNNGIHDTEEVDQLPDPAPARKQRFIEPETQDFGLVVGSENDVCETRENDNNGYMSDEEDNTPSQQLQSEFEAFSSPPRHIPVSSPPRPVPMRNNGAVSTNRSPFSETRVGHGGRPAINAHSLVSETGNDSGSVERAVRDSISTSKATKRSLPQQYLTKQAVPTPAARPPASAPVRNGIAVPPLQSRSPVTALPTHAYSSHISDGSNHQSKQKVPASFTRAVQSSAQQHNSSGRTPASSAPVSGPTRTGDKADSAEIGRDYIEAQFDHFVAFGYEIGHIASAMEAACLERGPMTVVLESLKAGKGLPQKEKGVWTDYDDEKLRKIKEYEQREKKSGVASSSSGQNARERALVNRYKADLLAKHGPRYYALRLEFKNMLTDGLSAK